MLETINALKNNNMRKVALYDPTVVEEGNKILALVIKGRGTSLVVATSLFMLAKSVFS